MRVIDSRPASWFLFEDGDDLLLDVNCNVSAFGYSVLIRLTPDEVAEYRAQGRAHLSRMADATQDAGPPGPYQQRNIKPSYAGDRMMEAVRAWRTSQPDTAWLAQTQWYVPAENLLAYLTDSALQRRTPVADQTLWNITSAMDGRFYGTSRTQLWVRGPDGFTAMSSVGNTMDGELSRDGEITIVFTPTDSSQAQTVGYGHLRRVDDEWRMEMQMATGTGSIAMHWAYMTPWKGEGPPPDPEERALDDDLRSDEWRWLLGTTWSATDEVLFPDGATFAIDGYRNGYCWGEGSTAGGSMLRMAGSVTPEGSLYLLFSVADATAEARRGSIEAADGAGLMTWSQPSGGPVVGGARRTGG